ncbi:NAD(P)-dependent oxidoreductase [Paenibacillus polymyxa]|uniref:NAD(P)-dependent oxidoreductase n=1 Tax=Paenibacillus polymyxa TaxID=1406 RepID=UPI0019E10D06|nr:NAD(P)-dependent oxidoreductase [Paenibacillus polymyxa]KAF6631800.1 NAD(P)-dependent oxidoreductase [Paenibacillus sp. EKM208P]URJ60812.1 NAD(P)-dependent oxidoreductase [Paenibacillus polymyxa]
MKVIIFGATGTIGKALVKEAIKRKYQVTAAVRDPQRMTEQSEYLTVVQADILNPNSVTDVAKGHDAIISAYGPKFGEEEELLEATRSLLEGTRRSGVQRILVVGGAGSLKTENGERLMDTAEFPEEVKPLAAAHADALELYRVADVDWTYCSPAGMIESGKRTGQFRIGLDHLVVDELGHSRISVEDYAVALIDELVEGEFVNSRFTVGY